MKKLATATSALILGAVAPAQAQDPYDLGEISVRATRADIDTDIDRTGATIEVVTEQDLENASEARVADVLARLPGVSVSSNGGLGASTTLRIRGLDGRYVKVLIDGIDVTDPSSPQTSYNWGNLTTSNISRIEVLKGSSSSLYGSRAIGGVVNVTTAQATEPGNAATFGLEGGSFNTYRAGASLTSRTDRGGVALNLDRVQTDGFSSSSLGGASEPDGFESNQLSFSADYQATDILRLGMSALYMDAEGDFDEFGGDGLPPFDEYGTTETRAIRGFAELQTGAVHHTLSAQYYQNDRLSSSNGFDTQFDGDRRRFDYIGVYKQSEQMTYSFGADWERENFDSGFDSGSADNTGIFGELLFAPTSDVDLAASLRWDEHSNFGGNLSGRLAAAWRLSDATILRAVAATGFRAPSLYELNSTLYGNPNLNPENSATFELGVEQRLGGGSFVRATAFYTRIDDLIQFVTLSFVPVFTGQYQQVAGTSVSKGIELSGEWALRDNVALFGNYTYTDARDANDARLLRVPEHDVNLGIAAQFNERWEGNLSLQYVADRPDEFGTPMGNYTVVNAQTSYALTDQAQVYLRLENLFDETYETALGYNAAPRAAYFGIRATF